MNLKDKKKVRKNGQLIELAFLFSVMNNPFKMKSTADNSFFKPIPVDKHVGEEPPELLLSHRAQD